jgi:LacI family transcriptional regulator
MKKKGPITIKDIARELNISPSTVSRALKNHPDISQATKDAVNELAKEYHYKPNSLALSLRSQKTYTIGVVIPKVVHFFFSSVISGIEEVANEYGYHVMICQSDENEERERKSVETLVSTRVEGILASVSKNTENISHFTELVDDKLPLVFFDRALRDVLTDKVLIDDVQGAFIATEHLIQKGCKKIIHLSAPESLLIGQRRIEGYKKALEKYYIPIDDSLIYKCDSRDEALIVMDNICRQGIEFDGVFAVNDLTATGVLRALKNNGLMVPKEVKVVGFSDGFVANVTDPTLTTIDQHGYEMGKVSARLLLDRINGTLPNYSPVTKIIPVNLIERESSREGF